MGEVHHFLIENGKDAMVKAAETKQQRSAIQAAANYLADESADSYFFIPVWHKRDCPISASPTTKSGRSKPTTSPYSWKPGDGQCPAPAPQTRSSGCPMAAVLG